MSFGDLSYDVAHVLGGAMLIVSFALGGPVPNLEGILKDRGLDAATVLLQWSAGGLLFLWFTTRRREVDVTDRLREGGVIAGNSTTLQPIGGGTFILSGSKDGLIFRRAPVPQACSPPMRPPLSPSHSRPGCQLSFITAASCVSVGMITYGVISTGSPRCAPHSGVAVCTSARTNARIRAN